NSTIQKIKEEFHKTKENLNAHKITAIVSSFDPLHRAHERMFRYSLIIESIVSIRRAKGLVDLGNSKIEKAYIKLNDKKMQDEIKS
ncbi:hypothetical protein VWN77_10335, partial [Campylobacter coli]